MKTLQGLLEELDGAAELTRQAQLDLADAVMAELDAHTILADYEAEVRAEAVQIPKLAESVALQEGYVAEMMGTDPGARYRADYVKARRARLEAGAEYDYQQSLENNTRAIVIALTAGRE